MTTQFHGEPVMVRRASFPADEELVQDVLLEYDRHLMHHGVTPMLLGQELTSLPGIYDQPKGTVLLAQCGDWIAGCAALTRADDGACEVRRLHARDGADVPAVLKALLDAAAAFAHRAGYEALCVRGLPGMDSLYRCALKFGFAPMRAAHRDPSDDLLCPPHLHPSMLRRPLDEPAGVVPVLRRLLAYQRW